MVQSMIDTMASSVRAMTRENRPGGDIVLPHTGHCSPALPDSDPHERQRM